MHEHTKIVLKSVQTILRHHDFCNKEENLTS